MARNNSMNPIRIEDENGSSSFLVVSFVANVVKVLTRPLDSIFPLDNFLKHAIVT
jgi:hypothetical protein